MKKAIPHSAASEMVFVGRLTVHYTDNDGHEGMLKIDEMLNVVKKEHVQRTQ